MRFKKLKSSDALGVSTDIVQGMVRSMVCVNLKGGGKWLVALMES